MSGFKKFKDKKGNSYPYLYIDEASGIFYAVARRGAKVLKSSLETTDFNTARSKLYTVLRDLEITKNVVKTNKLVKEYAADMLKEKIAQEIKESTQNRIEVILEKSILPFWGNFNASHVTQDNVTLFMLWHKEHRKGIQFVNVFKYLGNLFRFMHERGAISIIPKLEIPKTEIRQHAKKKGRVATDEELKKIFSHMSGQTKLITQIALSTGMRQMEIGLIETSRIRKIGETIVFCLDTDDTKTGMAREIPIPSTLNAEIEVLIKKDSQFLFTQYRNEKKPIDAQAIDKAWRKARDSAGIIGRLRFHDLRHTCATTMARRNINPVIACTMLGMSLRTFQKTYLNLSTQDLIIASETLFKSFGESHG